jgi:hypothetical protein
MEELQYLCASGRPWDRRACRWAVEYGPLAVLNSSSGCPWDEEACKAAAWGGHLEILQYLEGKWLVDDSMDENHDGYWWDEYSYDSDDEGIDQYKWEQMEWEDWDRHDWDRYEWMDWDLSFSVSIQE